MSTEANTPPLQGGLTMADVPGVFAKLRQQPVDQWPDALDLSGIDRADSSALAMLLTLKAQATAAGRAWGATNPPEALLTLADLGGVSQLLDWPSLNETTPQTDGPRAGKGKTP